MSPTHTASQAEGSPNGKVIFADERACALLGGSLERLARPVEAIWRPVKHNSSRTVYRGEINGREVYLKHFHNASPVHRLLRRLGSSDARRELRFSQYLQSCGVPTAPALAAACDGEVEWLATEAVAPAEPADVWHARQLGRGATGRTLIQQAIIALARMVGQMHAAGVIHRDLHTGNVLVRAEAPGELAPPAGVQLVLMDLHRACRRRKLSRRARAANLAQLFHDRYYFTTRTERLRFLKHYLAASRTEGSLRGWQWMVEHFGRLHTRRQHKQRDRRIFRTGQYFTTLKLAKGWRGHVVLDSKRNLGGSRAAQCRFTLDDWRQALARPESLLEGNGAEIVKNSPSSMVARRTLAVGPHRVEVYVKRRRQGNRWKLLIDCFRRSRALRAFSLGHKLLTRRIATALPLAALERRVGPALVDSLLITEAVGAPRLNDFLNTWLATPPRHDAALTVPQQRQLAQEVLWQLGRLVQRLHDNHFAHRDLKATNMLIRWSPGTPPEVVLLDLDGLTRRRVLTARRRFQGLMRLNVSLLKCPVVNRAGRLRMLLGYLRRPGCGRIEYKPYWRMLEEWSARKLGQQIRSRRRRQRAVRRPRP